jgi:hypothetical protein
MYCFFHKKYFTVLLPSWHVAKSAFVQSANAAKSAIVQSANAANFAYQPADGICG